MTALTESFSVEFTPAIDVSQTPLAAVVALVSAVLAEAIVEA